MQSPSQRITFVLTFPLPLLLVAFPCPKDKKTSGAPRHTSTFLSPLSCANKSKRHGEIAQALVKQQHRLCFVQCLSSFSSFLASPTVTQLPQQVCLDPSLPLSSCCCYSSWTCSPTPGVGLGPHCCHGTVSVTEDECFPMAKGAPAHLPCPTCTPCLAIPWGML